MSAEPQKRDPGFDAALCPGHEPLLREMRSGFESIQKRIDARFDSLSEKVSDRNRDIGEVDGRLSAVSSSLDDAWDTIEGVYGSVDTKIAAHKSACAIGDITKTEVRLPDRIERAAARSGGRYDTPSSGTRKTNSLAPSGSVFKIPVPKLIIWIAIAAGISVAAGGWAWGLFNSSRNVETERKLRDAIRAVVSQQNDTDDPDTGAQ